MSAHIKITDRKLIFFNSYFKVFSDAVIHSDGRIVSDFISVVPNVELCGYSGVKVLMVGKDGSMILPICSNHLQGRQYLGLFGGFIEPSDINPAASIVRELREELDIETPEYELEILGEYLPEPGLLSAKSLIYLCKINSEPTLPPSKEFGLDGLVSLSSREIFSPTLHFDLSNDLLAALAFYMSRE